MKTVGSSLESKSRGPIWSSNPAAGKIPQRNDISLSRRLLHSHAHSQYKKYHQAKCLSSEEWIKTMCYKYTIEYYAETHKGWTAWHLRWQLQLQSIKWNRPGIERKVLNDLTQTEDLRKGRQQRSWEEHSVTRGWKEYGRGREGSKDGQWVLCYS